MGDSDIKTWAKEAFARFKGIWQFDDFWTRGNTFNAALRFVMAAKAKWPSDPDVEQMEASLKEMVSINKTWLEAKVVGAWWADDFGWWGVACLTAREYLLSIGDAQSAENYLELAQQCWTEMQAHGYDCSDFAQPVPHGCENSSTTIEGGTKNTVTNANLFLLSVRLYCAAASTQNNQLAAACLSVAYSQYLWFSRWFESQYDYLRVIPSFSAGLVQERPIASPSYERKDHPTWESGWIWTGDQGLLLAALIEIFEIRDALYMWISTQHVANFDRTVFEKDVTGYVKLIVTGIKSLLFGSTFSPTDSVVREAPFNSSFISDPKDYVCGRGVLMRYLSETSANPFVKGQFNKRIATTAAAAWASCDTANNQFGARWNPGNDLAFNKQFAASWGNGDIEVTWDFPPQPDPPCNAILQATGLDVLGAAIPILG